MKQTQNLVCVPETPETRDCGGKKRDPTQKGEIRGMFRAGSSGTCQDPETNRSPLRSGPRRARNFQSSGNSTRPCRLKDLESPAFRLTRFGVDCPQTSNTRPEKSRPGTEFFSPVAAGAPGHYAQWKNHKAFPGTTLDHSRWQESGVRSSLAIRTPP